MDEKHILVVFASLAVPAYKVDTPETFSDIKGSRHVRGYPAETRAFEQGEAGSPKSGPTCPPTVFADTPPPYAPPRAAVDLRI